MARHVPRHSERTGPRKGKAGSEVTAPARTRLKVDGPRRRQGKAADVLTSFNGGIALSENLTKLFTPQFSDVLRLKLQQTMSMLRGTVMEGSHVGKQASPVQYAGAVQMKPPQGRF